MIELPIPKSDPMRTEAQPNKPDPPPPPESKEDHWDYFFGAGPSLSDPNEIRPNMDEGGSRVIEGPPKGYRRNVGICLINPSNKIFASSRLDKPESWQMPQAPYWLTYDFPPEVKIKHRSDTVDWIFYISGNDMKCIEFTGKEEEINLLGDGTSKAEFGEWSWMMPQQVIDLVVDFKKPVYEEILKVFTPYLQ